MNSRPVRRLRAWIAFLFSLATAECADPDGQQFSLCHYLLPLMTPGMCF